MSPRHELEELTRATGETGKVRRDDALRAWVIESRAKQGLPAVVSDPGALARVARILAVEAGEATRSA